MEMRCLLTCFLFLYTLRVSQSDLYSVLEVLPDALDSDIKKSYRRLALELHPDKIRADCSESEKEMLTLKFLEIQNAYEILGNAESRLRYDLSTQGIEYSKRDVNVKDRYTSSPFVMFAKTKHVKMMFSANFKKKPIPEIGINVAISARDIFSTVSGNVSFYRSVKCKICGGNGGTNGSCATCGFCNGYGSANHLFSDKSHSYEQMTKTECGICGGRGCVHDAGQCPHCKGSGFVMELTSIAYSLPVGFADGSEVGFSGIGHEDLDGDVGSVKLRFMISYPPMWSAESSQSYNLIYNMNVPFKIMEKGLKNKILSISGEEILVEHEAIDLITALTSTVSDIVISSKGLIAADGVTRGALVVKITITYDDLSTKDILSALKLDDFDKEDGIFGKLFDVLKPSPCSSADDEDEQVSCSKEKERVSEKQKFATSSKDITFL